MEEEKILIIISLSTCENSRRLLPMLEPLIVELNKIKCNFIFINTMNIANKHIISPIFDKIKHYPFMLHTTADVWNDILDGNTSRYHELNVFGAYYNENVKFFQPNTTIKYSPYDISSVLLWLNNEKRNITEFTNILNKHKNILENELHTFDDLFSPHIFKTLIELDRDIIAYFYYHNDQHKNNYFAMGTAFYHLIQKYILKYSNLSDERRQFLTTVCKYYDIDMAKWAFFFDFNQEFDFDLISLVKIIAGEHVENGDEILCKYIEFLFEDYNIEEFVVMANIIKTFIKKIYREK